MAASMPLKDAFSRHPAVDLLPVYFDTSFEDEKLIQWQSSDPVCLLSSGSETGK